MSKFKKYGIPASLLAGGLAVGSVLAPIGLASAQEDGSETDEGPTGADESTDGRHRHRGGGRDSEAMRDVVEDLLGLSQEELKVAFDEGQTLAEIAEAEGVSTEDLVASLVAAAEDRIDQAVEDGRIDADNAEERSADLETRIEERVTTTPGEFEGRRGHGRQGGRGLGIAIEVLGELGLTTEDLATGRSEGQTLVEVAEDAGVSETELVGALVGAAEEAIDQKVADGDIDVERADDVKADLEERISERVNSEPREDGEHHRGGPHGAHADGETKDTGTA
jgi:uncharacterized protein YidB (DUF937 family)